MGTHPIFESDFDCLTGKMGRDKIEDDMRKRHDPDLSNEAWDKRWEKAKQVKQQAREKDREKLKLKLENSKDGKIEIDGLTITKEGSKEIGQKRKRTDRDEPEEGEISDSEDPNETNPKDYGNKLQNYI